MNDCKRCLQVLLVEDNQGDAFLIKEILRDTEIDLNVSVAENGQKALDMLNRTVGGINSTYDLVILDLNLPKVHGLEVLSYMKSMHGLKQITVVIMTGSLNQDDETKARAMGANSYLIKPACNEEFETILRWMKGTLGPMAASENLDNAPAGPGGKNGQSAMCHAGAAWSCVRRPGKQSHTHRLKGPAPPSCDWQDRMDRPW
jgi:CheY-like chemotaxis protein